MPLMKLFLVSVSAYMQGTPVRPLLGTPTDDGTGRCSACSHAFDVNDPKCYCTPPEGVAYTFPEPKWFHGVGWTFGESWEKVKDEVTRQVLENQLPALAGWKNHKIQGLPVPDDVIRQAYHDLTADTDIVIGSDAAIPDAELHQLENLEQPSTLIPEGVADTLRLRDAAQGLTMGDAMISAPLKIPGNDEVLTPTNG